MSVPGGKDIVTQIIFDSEPFRKTVSSVVDSPILFTYMVTREFLIKILLLPCEFFSSSATSSSYVLGLWRIWL